MNKSKKTGQEQSNQDHHTDQAESQQWTRDVIVINGQSFAIIFPEK